MRTYYSCFFLLLTVAILSCTDDDNIETDITEILEPVDALIQLQNITRSDDNSVQMLSINVDYNERNLISQITFTGSEEAVYTMSYAVNDRLTSIEKVEGGESSRTSLEYVNDIIIARTTFPNGTIEDHELMIDFQNRIAAVNSFAVSPTGSRTATDRLEYNYTQNFNVSTINDRTANGSAIEATTSFTYFFNNNPFADMNDVIRFLIFPDFVPYTRYLPATQIDREVVNGTFVQTRAISYTYTLLDNDYPSSRKVETMTAAGTSTTTETFTYRP